ncbi:RNA 3'-terminal phosphate cyclase [Citricoccus sp. K5]|nr:RNA 3'-terminal phosphate cyclase [Citricoccus sp. K5]
MTTGCYLVAMALNFNQLLSIGRRVARIARQVQRQSPPRNRSGGHASGPGGLSDYPGDFHGRAQVSYSPVPGPEAGPGEIVWTWVPFEELDGRGKDRPVLVVGRNGGHLLAAQLTSRDRNNAASRDADYIDIGAGPWDPQGRNSEVKLDRILQVNPRDVRREGGVLDQRVFETVSQGLRDRNGWS